MLKFVAGSPGDDAVIRAGQTSPPNLAALEPVIGELQDGVELPLRVAQISSGNWLLLNVDFQALANQLAARLRGRENVMTVQARASEAEEPGGKPRSVEVLVKFAPGSAEDKAVASALEGGTVEPLADMLSELEQGLGLPLAGAANDPGELALQVDLEALTLSLVDTLKELPDVESAQPNYVLGAFKPGPRGSM
jgi:hypothetical protein